MTIINNSSETVNHSRPAQEIDVSVLFSLLWKKKLLILVVTAVFSCIAAGYSLTLSDVYRSEVVLSSVSDTRQGSLSGQLGGLAAIAGINLASMGSSDDKTGTALEILKSRDFIGRFVKKHDLLVPLIAAEGWERSNDTLILDASLYDSDRKVWVRRVDQPFLPQPSLLEAHEEFIKKLNVIQDESTGILQFSFTHYSPYFAQRLLVLFVKDINDEMRQRDIVEAQRSIDYLNKQVSETNLADIKSLLYSLIEEQTKTLMLANAREEYVFKTIDQAYIPEKKAAPKRSLIVVLSALLGLIFSVIFILLRYIRFRPQQLKD